MQNKTVSSKKSLRAYIIGLALGDGNLSNPNGRGVRLRISCDTKYPKLITRIQQCLKELLPNNKTSLFKRKARCVDISCYSNSWPKILSWHKLGSKYRQSVDVPEWIKENKTYIKNCLRGLIETDGTVYSDRGYKMVMFVTIISPLADSVMKMIMALGFESKIYSFQPKTQFKSKKIFHIRIAKNVEKFLKLTKIDKS